MQKLITALALSLKRMEAYNGNETNRDSDFANDTLRDGLAENAMSKLVELVQ